MDSIAVQLRTKYIQLGLRMILFLHLTSYMWPQDTPVSDLQVSYDYIIVGCGTAGSILASRLSESGDYSVLVIEAGGDPPLESLYPSTFSYLPNSQYDWNFTTINDGYTAQAHRNHMLELPKGKMIGGDSSLGHLHYVRGDPNDYNQWAKVVKDSSWNYENLLPYFKKSENQNVKKILHSPNGIFHGISGNMGVTKLPKHVNKKYLHAFKEAGNNILYDASGHKTLGYFEPMFMIKDGIRQSMPYTYLTLIKNRRNLHLLKDTEAIEINFDGNIAVGVTAVKNGRILKLKSKREVIIAAGTIKSPQLLMLSGIGLRDHLESYNIQVRAHLPVGKNYQDHLDVMMVHKLSIKNHKSPTADPHDYPLPVFIGNVAMNKTKSYPDYQSVNYIVSSDLDDLLTLCSVVSSFNDEICQSLYNRTKGYETMVSKVVLLHPQSRGHVVLQSRCYRDPPMIISGLFSHDEDLDRMVSYIADFLRIAETSVLRKLGVEFVHPKLQECDNFYGSTYLKCYALNMMGTAHHYTGTCGMGKVVDNRLRVLGMKSLRVVDASVIPIVTSGSTQADVMAIAEKGADMILADAKAYP